MEFCLRIQCDQKCQNHNNKFFPKIFLTKSPFFEKKLRFLEKNKMYFRILEVHPVILTTYLPC